MQPRKAGDRWVIAGNLRTMNSEGHPQGTSGSFRNKIVFECLGGSGWCDQLEMAMDFPSEADTREYIEANRKQIEDAD
jgi:hypothetical protein